MGEHGCWVFPLMEVLCVGAQRNSDKCTPEMKAEGMLGQKISASLLKTSGACLVLVLGATLLLVLPMLSGGAQLTWTLLV